MVQLQLPGAPEAVMCREPYCGESHREVPAQQFNVVQLQDRSGEVVSMYYGERWQSTPDGLKAHDFSYLEPLRFAPDGVMMPLDFASSFDLAL